MEFMIMNFNIRHGSLKVTVFFFFAAHPSIFDARLEVDCLIAESLKTKVALMSCPLCPITKVKPGFPYLIKKHLKRFHMKHSFVSNGEHISYLPAFC